LCVKSKIEEQRGYKVVAVIKFAKVAQVDEFGLLLLSSLQCFLTLDAGKKEGGHLKTHKQLYLPSFTESEAEFEPQS